MSNLPSKKNISKKGKKAVKKVVKKVERREHRNLAGNSNGSVATINATAKMASKIMGAGYQFAGLKQSKGKLRGRLSNWLEALADPFSCDPQKCPVNFNPMPTLQTTTMRTTYTAKLVAIASSNAQLALYPGHTALVDSDEMDGPSYHQNWQYVGSLAGVRPVGPMQYPDASAVNQPPIGGVYSVILSSAGGGGGGIAANSACVDTSVTTAPYASYPMYYDVAVPFTGSSKNGFHTRYKLTAMEVRFLNETPEVNRGGSFYSVQPLNSVSFSAINQYALYPTFRDHGICDEREGRVSWIPRVQDLAFYHPGASTSYTNSISNAGIIVWFVNSTAYQQNLSVEVVYHWEVGGQNLQTMSTSSVQMPSDANIVSPTLSFLQQGSHTAAPAPRVAETVATASSPWADSALGKAAQAAGKAAKEVALEEIKKHIGSQGANLGIKLAGHLAELYSQ